MKWGTVTILNEAPNGQDSLGNEVKELIPVRTIRARVSAATDENTALEGRDVTRVERIFMLPVSDTSEFTHIKHECGVYKAEDISTAGRWVTVRAVLYEDHSTRKRPIR